MPDQNSDIYVLESDIYDQRPPILQENIGFVMTLWQALPSWLAEEPFPVAGLRRRFPPGRGRETEN